jgi:DNA processing protein
MAAVVGTVSPGKEAAIHAHSVVSALVRRGFVVVSGLASGCDTLAHAACLDVRGKTIAVLAHGLDYCYPRANYPLFRAILEKGGLLLSEYPAGVRPKRQYFVIRNRLQSGLGRGICVIEAEREGGTMHTARFACKQKRLVGCVPSGAGGNVFLLSEKNAWPLGTEREIETFIDMLEHEVML